MSETPVFDWTLEWATTHKLSTWSIPEMESTNTAAKEWRFGPIAPPPLFLTKRQTAGRGRGTNSWKSVPGALLSSWVFETPFAPQPVMSPLAGLALFRSVCQAWPDVSWGLKPPNDLYIAGSKVAGLLIETISAPPTFRIIIGLGMNISSSPDDLTEATCLAKELRQQSIQVEKADFFRFLDQWWTELDQVVRFGMLRIMPPEICAELRDAINARQLIHEHVASVSEEGNIIYTSKKQSLHWSEL